MSQTVCFITRIGNSAFKYTMEIVVHNSQVLSSTNDIYQQYSVPVWEIEIQSDVVDSPEFTQSLAVDSNFVVSQAHNSELRSVFAGEGVVKDFLSVSHKEKLLDIALDHPATRPRFNMSQQHYQTRAGWLSTILRDQAGFSMTPHIDNSHVVMHMIVNLVQDNETATDFYLFD